MVVYAVKRLYGGDLPRKRHPEITSRFNKENLFAKLDCNFEGFAPIGFGRGDRTLSAGRYRRKLRSKLQPNLT